MDSEREWNEQEAAAELLDWWVESGVDVAVGETPRNWLQTAEPRSESPASPPQPTVPEDFDSFRRWLAEAPGLPLERPSARRVLPHGGVGAEIMLLSEMPGREDEERPIGGAAWALAVKMLAAIGISAETAYSASLACFQAPGARLSGDELTRCGEIARRHVALAAPRRLILLGDAPCRALLGQPLATARGHIHKIEGIRTIATFHPRWLLQRPADKALAWRDLLLLMEEER